MLYTRKNVKPAVEHGYEAILLGVLPCLIPILVPKLYVWGVYPLPPKRTRADDFIKSADAFLRIEKGVV